MVRLNPSVDDPADHGEPLALHEHIDRMSGAEVPPPPLGLGIRNEDHQRVAELRVLHGRGDRSVRHAPDVPDDTR